MSDFRILRQRCETLEKMVEVLQLSPCPVSAPLHDRYQVIKDLSDTYSINLLCQALKVTKGSYYNHILRNANENTSYMRKKKEITPIIEEIFMEAFFKSLKAEELYRNNYRSEREFRERVQKYIDFYNDKRPHQINRYRTPNATEEAYYKRHADDLSRSI